MIEKRKLTLRKENLSELTRHELQAVAGGDVREIRCISCDQCDSWVTCGGVTIATCQCPTGASCPCPTATFGC